MRLSPVQRDIMTYLARCGKDGGYIGSTTRAPEFFGLDLWQVERALAGLVRRGIVYREGIRYKVREEN